MKLRLVRLLAVTAAAMVTPSAQQVGPAVRQPPAQQPPQPGAPNASQPQSPSGLILGRAIDATTERPLARVTVVITGGAPGGPVAFGAPGPARVLTDAEGRFVLRDVPAGSFTLTATKPGYVAGAYGKRSPSGNAQPLELTDGDRVGNVTIPLWKCGVISGRVVDEAGEPMPAVQVRVLRRTLVAGQWRFSQMGNQPTTDDRGIYRTDSLVPGQYLVGVVSAIAATPSELYESYIRAIAAGTSQDFSRSVDPAASLSSGGGVRAGDQVLFYPGVSAPGAMAAGVASTQQLLIPGAPVGDRRMFVYPSLFYPSAATATQADMVTVAAGVERSNIDFQMRPSPAVTVSGTVVGPDGPSPSTALQLLPAGVDRMRSEYGFEAATTISDRRGAFKFVGVVPGQYTIRVLRTPQRPQTPSAGIQTIVQIGSSTISSFRSVESAPPPIPNDPTLWGGLGVSVGQADVSGLSVVLSQGSRIAGRVEFSGTAKPPEATALPQLNLTVEPSDGRATGSVSASSIISRLQVDGQGIIHSYQFPEGKYVIRSTGGPTGWTFVGAFLNGKDVSVTPLELGASDVDNLVVKYTDRPAELSGTVRDESRVVDRSVDVLLFPADPRAWTDYGPTPRRFRNIATSSSGTYRITGVADGDYFIVAVRDGLPADWQDLDVLKKLAPLAIRVTVAEGDKKVQDLKLGVLR